MCDEQGIPGYLESSNPANIPFYRRHGYELAGEIQVGSSPVVTPMWRARGKGPNCLDQRADPNRFPYFVDPQLVLCEAILADVKES